ncbi:3'-Phosphoadenosine 5'-phosphosulfate (PAPS) 3'-phosphatase (CysQ) [Commensalibacter communis]|uniref:3'(2'),5'-bisphosphate nucleotidase CysQ n=1 Tax=Commensalibacter communis TaxID=2972786 RepID=A0A9W4TKG7_9PROT|nr:3'(2'),5'-bisphosphate nucleotidase CysQ [Commensalibacter communis]CAI3924395.1 3'-Phosphoadenosine 5'-phosphosulfate (PAPS) 3'-phosphatase (CysQ) [Commensalibacter communis]CAI3925883.1 3'-Phosphoadenosine 5'-phosphosulfate (PAPS) 3'-phosphatase (CysQ) [Commensalibacter communis]CAI3928819.1 3'-Phosphoadenosine 5'-phosphosulfate (PAPS) 3'-phosphatase (CysQ) [Commensalibacter communis]CAI3936555.1 3'-Phosphoadenosine 5'-phosphosulfate (PAPS) 3'-phosphatase (CysQ) [Commensalibacter communis]
MHPFSDQQLMKLAIDLAAQATVIINEIREKGLIVSTKSDLSPVTQADKASETLILQGLRKAVPSIPIIAEEETSEGIHTKIGSEFWLIDPLDGTKGFIRGSKNFTINIGLIRNHKPVMGVVALPAYNEIFCGIVGQGAWRIENNKKIPIHVSTLPKNGFRIITSHNHSNDPQLSEKLENFPACSIKAMGSAAKIIRIAEGKADLHFRLNSIMEWDTAAPQAILEAAGGYLRSFDNQPLQYGKEGSRIPPFFCSSTLIDDYLSNFE